MSDLEAIKTALIREFRASGSYNRIAIWQGIQRVMDAAIEAEAATGEAEPELDDIEAFVYGLTVASVGADQARRFGAAVRKRLAAQLTRGGNE